MSVEYKLATLNTTELLAYLDAQNKELFGSKKCVTVIPWTVDALPTFEETKRVLERYQPEETDKRDIVNQTKVFLALIEKVREAPGHTINEQVYVCRHMFRMLEANVWFLNAHKPFRNTVRGKLIEFMDHDKPQVTELAQEFAWMAEFPYPDKQQCVHCSKSSQV